MDEIKTGIEGVCLISIFTGLIGAAIPQGKMKKAFTAFCSAVIIFSIVIPVGEFKADGKKMFDITVTKNEQLLLAEVETAQQSLYEGVLGSAVENELEKSGYSVTVKAECRIDADEIIPYSFTVIIADNSSATADIEAYLKSSFGEDITVNFEVTDNNE